MTNKTPQMHPDLPIAEWPFEDLLEQYTPLIGRYSSFVIAHHDRDDLSQELAILLHRCQQKFDPSKGVQFFFYFNQACKNQIAKIAAREKRRGAGLSVSLDQHMDTSNDERGDWVLSGLDLSDHALLPHDVSAALALLSPAARRFVDARLNGTPLHHVLTRQEVNNAKRELKDAFGHNFLGDRTPQAVSA